jgi:hypothetical protein
VVLAVVAEVVAALDELLYAIGIIVYPATLSCQCRTKKFFEKNRDTAISDNISIP